MFSKDNFSYKNLFRRPACWFDFAFLWIFLLCFNEKFSSRNWIFRWL